VEDQVDDELFDLLASTVGPLGLELVDVERHAAVVRVVVDKNGGVDLDAIAEATRAVSLELDRLDPVPGRYTLEVSSPGVERPLRIPAHFARAVGEQVSVRTVAGAEGERRVAGRLAEAGPDGIVIEGADIPDGRRRLTYDEVQRARTVFSWGPAPRAARRDDGGKRTRAHTPTASMAAGKRKAATS
jgi:ribosome maturation factor RimP